MSARRFRHFTSMLALAASLAACSATSPSPTLQKVSLGGSAQNTPDGYQIGLKARGQTAQITVTGTYSDGSTKDLTKQASFTSQQPAVATVNADGVVSPVGEGLAGLQVFVLGFAFNVTVFVSGQ